MSRLWKTSRAQRLRNLAEGGVVFACVLGVLILLVEAEKDRATADLRNRVENHVLGIATKLDAEFDAAQVLTKSMVPVIVSMPEARGMELNAMLRAVYRFGRHIRNIGIAPNNRLTLVFPEQGNEGAIGLYYPDVPAQWPAVQRAIETQSAVLAGPVALKQGGTGLISRTPVYLDDGSYWGILSIVLDAESLFDAVGLEPNTAGIRLAARGTDATGSAGAVFLGDPSLFKGDSQRVTVDVPGGSWVLAARPVGGWGMASEQHWLLEVVAVTMAAVVGVAVFGYREGRQGVLAREKRLRAIMDTTKDGVVVIDNHGVIHEYNPAAARMFGYDRDDMIGSSVNRLMPADEAARHDAYVRRFREDTVREMSAGRQIVGRRKDGSVFPAEITLGDTIVGDKRLHVGVIRDISERKAFEAKLIEMASVDELTGALNRRAFLEQAHTLFQLARRHGHALSLIMADADHFKAINDTHGHHVGDAVLARLAAVFRCCLRETDLFGRLGGEEFAVLLPQTDQASATQVADRLLGAVRATEVQAKGDGAVVRFTVSIGIARSADPEESLDDIIRHADEALYQAKTAGRDQWQIFSDPKLREDAREDPTG